MLRCTSTSFRHVRSRRPRPGSGRRQNRLSRPPAPPTPRRRLSSRPAGCAPAVRPKRRRQKPSSAFPIYPARNSSRRTTPGRGQRYYLYGSDCLVCGAGQVLPERAEERGELVFDAPATHVFEVGRFREETMAYPPGVTIKDYTSNGSRGLSEPENGAQPARFPPSFR